MFPFDGGIHRAATVAQFHQMPRRDQNAVMQDLYNQGYSGKDIAKFYGMSAPSVYNRIDATRGRGPEGVPA
jgi:transposase